MSACVPGSAALAALVLFAAASVPSTAAPAAGQAGRERPEAVKRVADTATAAEDESGTCNRARRRLWVEGEGWVVRRITVCR